MRSGANGSTGARSGWVGASDARRHYFGLGNELLTWARFYLEPVQEGGGNVDAAVRRQVGAAGPPSPASLTEQR